MNIFVSNQNSPSGLVGRFGRNAGGAQWNTGDMLQAILSDVNGGKATLRTEDGFTFTANASDIQGNVGDTLTFQINRTQEGFSLTQMLQGRTFQETLQAERGSATPVDGYEEHKELVNNVESMREAETLREEYRQEREAKVLRVLASIRRAQNFIGGGSQSVISAIIDGGIDLTKISFADLNRVMHSMDRTPGCEISKEALIDGINSRNWSRPENARHIVTSLFNHGLEVNDKNVNAMETAYERLPESVSPTAIEELVAKEQDLTLDNVYKSGYAYDTMASKTIYKTVELPQDVIKNFFTREGIEITPRNLQTAQFLIDRDIPLNRENIEKVQFLQGLTRHPVAEAHAIASGLFFDQAAEHLGADTPIGTIRLMEVTRFAETQLKAALKAANLHQGLNIDVNAMREHVRELQINEEEALRFLKMAGAKAEPETAAQMTTLFDLIAALKPPTVNAHAGIMHGDIDFTVKAVGEAVQYAKAMSGYEQNATVPMARYGDSLNTIKGQFAPLLENMGITATSENTKAAFILSKNNIDVTPENLAQVKAIDAKISEIANKLHPMIAAHMIKDGLSPLDMHADQVLAYIKQFNIDIGESGEDKISRHIMDMDNEGILDPEVRKSMIAIYRMLNVIRRDGAAALGLAMQMEDLKSSPMTLGDLLNLAQKPKTNVNMTDDYGHLENLTRPKDSIRAVLSNTVPPTYGEIITENFIEAATPSNLENMLTSSLGEAIEDLAMSVYEVPEKTPQSATAQAQIQTFVSANPEIINQLQKHNIIATPGNIRAFEKLSTSRRALADELEDISTRDSSEDVTHALPDSSLAELREGKSPEQIISKILFALGDTHRSGISSMLAVTHGLNSNGENGFQIPIKLGDKVANLSLYVLNEGALASNGAKVLMSLDTESLGVVNTYFTINGHSVDVTISAETREAADTLALQQAYLETFMTEAGASIGELTFKIAKEPAPNSAAAIPDYKPQPETDHDYRV
ncbi:MAG: DUF6240 domain-containing protein [Defluviitaleaceae bacterium]|nr:DUF6240 domain-containing protein [Defluviitaleaceae bacterium]